MHRLLVPAIADVRPGDVLTVLGDEAHHAVRVKRLKPGEPVEAMDGMGRVAAGTMRQAVKLGKQQGWSVELSIEACREFARLSPAVHLWTAAPKGPRLEHMVDQLSQVGAASWGSLHTARSVVDPRSGKLDRLQRVCLESAKQCGRAWAMRIEPGRALGDLLTTPGLVVADASGEPWSDARRNEGPAETNVLVGPEGGWSADEVSRLRDAGARVVRFGPHVMRIETAAVVAAGALLVRVSS